MYSSCTHHVLIMYSSCTHFWDVRYISACLQLVQNLLVTILRVLLIEGGIEGGTNGGRNGLIPWRKAFLSSEVGVWVMCGVKLCPIMSFYVFMGVFLCLSITVIAWRYFQIVYDVVEWVLSGSMEDVNGNDSCLRGTLTFFGVRESTLVKLHFHISNHSNTISLYTTN